MLNSQRGHILSVMVVLVVIACVVGLVALKLTKKPTDTPAFTTVTPQNLVLEKPPLNCADSFTFSLPIDIAKATSVLYPGQIRSGDFKAHGGFRFENSLPEDILVKAPIDAKVIAGARYPSNTGDIQYTFDFENDCGIRYRLGHLLTLSPKFHDIAQQFPMPEGLDSRTTQVHPPIEVKKGEIIATAVGMTKNGSSKNGTNTFLDWGVYDYRQKNAASQDPNWAASHTSDTYQYAVCWFDWISPEDREKVLALPSADSENGKTSDFCK